MLLIGCFAVSRLSRSRGRHGAWALDRRHMDLKTSDRWGLLPAGLFAVLDGVEASLGEREEEPGLHRSGFGDCQVAICARNLGHFTMSSSLH